MIKRVILAAAGWGGRLLFPFLSIISPLVDVRVSVLLVQRIGQLLQPTEYTLRQIPPRRGRRQINIFVSTTKLVCNNYLLDLVARRILVVRSRILSSILYAIRDTGYKHPRFLNINSTGESDYALWRNTEFQNLIAFNETEKLRGQKLLAELGIEDGQPFICFAARDGAYLSQRFPPEQQIPPAPADNWRYQDYRDSSITTFVEMANTLAEREFHMLRMGAIVSEQLSNLHPRVIDYAAKHRSEFGDLYLLSHCKFFVGDTAGIVTVPLCSGVPVALANFLPLRLMIAIPPKQPGLSHLQMPKKFRGTGQDTLMAYRDVVALGAGSFLRTQDYEAAGVEIINNSPEEIRDIALEMNQRIDKTWVDSPADYQLRERFMSIFPDDHPIHGAPTLIATTFLRRNRDLVI